MRLGAVVLLPALLAALGPRIDRLDVLAKLRRGGSGKQPRRPEDGFWHRLARAVMRRTVPVHTLVLTALAVVVMPFTKASFGLPDDRALPKDMAAAQAGAATRTDFSSFAGQELKVVLPDRRPDDAALTSYAEALSQVSGIDLVDTATGSSRDGARIAPRPPRARGPSSPTPTAPGSTLPRESRPTRWPAKTPSPTYGRRVRRRAPRHSWPDLPRPTRTRWTVCGLLCRTPL
ncbi:hypothetical protein [Streptomyces anthocyanicus]|uniref:hypothetical protein n=1 Tax=Streptomyces anthocyanicus TaxID=68174 RepID=UPI0016710B31|nr:hypothetical protein [Streptomyces anthocyanicus]